MKKEELIALGLTDEQQRAVQRLNGLDIERAKRATPQRRDEDTAANIRTAIVKMSYLLDVGHLRDLLLGANDLYAEQTAAPKTNTDQAEEG